MNVEPKNTLTLHNPPEAPPHNSPSHLNTTNTKPSILLTPPANNTKLIPHPLYLWFYLCEHHYPILMYPSNSHPVSFYSYPPNYFTFFYFFIFPFFFECQKSLTLI